jgi:putative peptidoglycan lipid II flippase
MGRPRWRWDHEGVRRVARLMLPGIFGSSVAQVSLLLDSLIASFMMVGSISWLYYADRLVEFPMGVFTIALATVILPRLSMHHAQASPERFADTLDSAVRLVFLLVTPAAVALLVLAGPLIATIYGYGEFTDRDVRMTTYALMMYAVGLLGFSMVKVLAPGYFARQDPRTPVRVGIISLGVNIGFNVAVVLPLSRSGFPAPHVLLAFSTGVYHASTGWRKFAFQVLVANLVMGVALWWCGGGLEAWLAYGAWERALRLGACVVGGAAVYFAALWASGLRYAQLRHIAGK